MADGSPHGGDKAAFREPSIAPDRGHTTNLSGGWLQGCDCVGSSSQTEGCQSGAAADRRSGQRGHHPNPISWHNGPPEAGEGITTTTFGVGMGYNEDLLTRMAHEGGGAFYFIDNPDQAAGLFAEELTDLYNVVGQNLTVAIETES